MALDFAGPYHNYAVSGDQSEDMATHVYAEFEPRIRDNSATTILIGHNDMHWCPGGGKWAPGDSAGCKGNFEMALTAAVAWIGIPPGPNKIAAQSATNSGCSADNAVRQGTGMKCSAAGDRITWVLKTTRPDQVVYVAWYGEDGNAGTATLTIDGKQVDTLTTASAYGQPIHTVNGATSTVWARRYVLRSAGSHAIVWINTGTSGFTVPEWVGTPVYDAAGHSSPPHIFAGDLIYEAAGKYAQGTRDYNHLIDDLIAQYAAGGINITRVDTSRVTQLDMGSRTATTQGPDGVLCQINRDYGQHPTNCGYWHLRQAFEAVMRPDP